MEKIACWEDNSWDNEVLTAVLLRIQDFWDVTLCCWVTNSHHAGSILNCLILKALHSFKISGTTHPVWHPRKTWIPKTSRSFRQEVTYSLWHPKVHYYLHNQPVTVPSTKPDKSIHTALSHLLKTNFDINVTCMTSLVGHPISSCFFLISTIHTASSNCLILPNMITLLTHHQCYKV